MFTYLYIYTHIYIWFCVACPIGCLKKAASRSSQPRELDIRSLTALAFVSSMSEPLRIKTCCSSVGVHHTVTTSSSSVASLSYADEVTPYADEVTPYDDNMEHAIR